VSPGDGRNDCVETPFAICPSNPRNSSTDQRPVGLRQVVRVQLVVQAELGPEPADLDLRPERRRLPERQRERLDEPVELLHGGLELAGGFRFDREDRHAVDERVDRRAEIELDLAHVDGVARSATSLGSLSTNTFRSSNRHRKSPTTVIRGLRHRRGIRGRGLRLLLLRLRRAAARGP
jgi:hypothetical protein